VVTRRIIVTGPPGCGKTATLSRLTGDGIEVVREAATDVNEEMLADGSTHPERRPDFLPRIVALQRARRLAADGSIQFHDRSVFCTVALARYLGVPMPEALAAELVAVRGCFENAVLFLEPLGFLTQTAVRRIGYQDSLVFGDLHREVYNDYGFTLVGIPATDPEHRAKLIRAEVLA
jgi:predicted ATPase